MRAAVFGASRKGTSLRSLLLIMASLCILSQTGWGQATVVSFGSWLYYVAETNAGVVIHINRGGDTNIEFSVDYSTADDTATAGHDYVPKSGTLSFPPGVNRKEITISI